MSTIAPAKPARSIDPSIPPRSLDKPVMDAREILSNDAIPPARTLIDDRSDWVPEVKPLDMKRYTSQEFHDAEVQKMWSKVWQYACWTGDIPNPGDISVYRNVGQSVIVVRQPDGSIKAFRNSCRHRGVELCFTDRNRQNLRCPYHAFTWSLEGELKWIPAQWDFPQIDRDNFNLPEVRCEVWNGLVFINMDKDAPGLETYFGSMFDQWKEWDFTNRYRHVTVVRKMNCNWKAVMDAFIETYHVYATHPEAAFLSPDSASQYDMYPDQPHFSRFHALVGWGSQQLDPEPNQQEVLDAYTSVFLKEVYGTPEGELQDGENARAALRRLAVNVYRERMGIDVSGAPNSELLDGTQYHLFPNFLLWPSIANPLVYRFRPGPTPDTSVWETFIFLRYEGEQPAPGPIIEKDVGESIAGIEELGYVAGILQQDCENLEYMQDGLKANEEGVMHLARYQEARIRHYHETIDKYLAD